MAGYKRKKIRLTKKTKDAATKKRERRFIGVFLVLLIIVASASAVTYFKEKAKNNQVKGDEQGIVEINDGSRKDDFF